MNTPRYAQQQQGSAILEALIAITLFSIGVLSIVGLQSAMVKQGSQAQFRSEAISLSDEMNALMWIDAANLSSFAIADCTVSVSNARAESWRSKVQSRMPKGCGKVNVAGNNVTISVSWQTSSEGVNTQTVSTTVLR